MKQVAGFDSTADNQAFGFSVKINLVTSNRL